MCGVKASGTQFYEHVRIQAKLYYSMKYTRKQSNWAILNWNVFSSRSTGHLICLSLLFNIRCGKTRTLCQDKRAAPLVICVEVITFLHAANKMKLQNYHKRYLCDVEALYSHQAKYIKLFHDIPFLKKLPRMIETLQSVKIASVKSHFYTRDTRRKVRTSMQPSCTWLFHLLFHTH